MKKYIWKNTYSQSMGEYFSHALKDEKYIDVFYMLWRAFMLEFYIKSEFFESLRIGDDKYELWAYKSKNGYVMVKFIIK